MERHFKGCHFADDDRKPEAPDGHEPQETEPCWHCGTCGRWWAYMTGINITTMTF